MDVQTQYRYLVERPDKGTQGLYIRGTGIRALTIWYDQYVSQMHSPKGFRPPSLIRQD